MYLDNNRDMEASDQQQASTLLLKLYNYHIKEDHLPAGSVIAASRSVVLLLAMAGALYYLPGYAFGEYASKNFDRSVNGTSEVVGVLSGIGSSYAGCIVLLFTAIEFWRRHVAPQFLPDALKDVIEPPMTFEQWLWDSAKILGVSSLASVPFVTVTYVVFYNYREEWWFEPLLIGIFLANDFLHFLSVKLMLVDPFYGYIPTTLKQLLLCQLGKKLSPEEQAEVNKKKAHLGKLAGINGILVNAHENFLDELTNDLNAAPNLLQSITDCASDDEFLKILLSYYKARPQLSPQAISRAKNTGIIFSLTAFAGYFANPLLVVNSMQLTPAPLVLLNILAVIGAYLLATLLAFFGDFVGVRLLTDIALRDDPEAIQWSPIVKLYPKIFAVFALVNVVLLTFSAAAAQQMLRLFQIDFATRIPDEAMFAWYAIAWPPIIVIAWYTTWDYQKQIMGDVAVYCNGQVGGDVMRYDAKFQKLLDQLWLAKPRFVDSLNQQIQDKLPATIEEVGVSHSNSWCAWCFACRKDHDGVNAPLLSK